MYAKPVIREADLRSEASSCSAGIPVSTPCVPINGQTLNYLIDVLPGQIAVNPSILGILGPTQDHSQTIVIPNQAIVQVCLQIG